MGALASFLLSREDRIEGRDVIARSVTQAGGLRPLLFQERIMNFRPTSDIEEEYVVLDGCRPRDKEGVEEENGSNAIIAFFQYAVVIGLGTAFIGGLANLIFIYIKN